MEKVPLNINVLFAGDAGVGKGKLMILLAKDHYYECEVPDMSDDYVKETLIDGKNISFCFECVSQNELFMRHKYYRKADVIVLAFSLWKPDSMDSLKSLWLPEIRGIVQRPNFIVAGLQSDERDSIRDMVAGPTISADIGLRFARSIGARGFYECSAKGNENIPELLKGIYTAYMDGKTNGSFSNPRGFCLLV